MKKRKVLSAVFLVLLVFVYGLSFGGNYKLICDDLSQTGGEASSPNFDLKVSAGGQPSPIGIGSSANYHLMAGYVYATFVKRGDANADGKITVSDVVYLINYLFKGGPAPIPLEAGDANCDGKATVSDVVYLINYLFKGGPPPC